ncbi:MAG: tagaturonate reductase [Planctomycetaceae bacterium]|nr:tagaturonate reductase [Planctomycetaceae bacterium]
MPATISKQWLAASGQPMIPDEAPIRVMQFGEGGFLRAFVDWIFKKLNDGGHFSGTVRVVQPIPQGMVDKLAAQDYVYSLVLRGMQNGEVMDEASFIDVIRDGVNPYADWNKFLAAAAEADLRYVVSNTTEAGIVYAETPKPTDCPATFPAKVAAMLEARCAAHNGAADKGLVFLPCELIEKNGEKLKDAVMRHLVDWGLADTVGKWVEANCLFYNTLVDRIVTGYPRGEAEAIWEKLGVQDDLLDVGEYFLLWVIEGDARLKDEVPFAKTGLDVIVTDNLKPYRDRKVRVLNGAHTGNVLGAYLAGMDTVGEMMADDQLGGNLRAMVREEILPGVKLPEPEKEAYAEAVFERFQNPFVRHELLSISLNSVSKWKVRVLPSLKDFVAEKGTLPGRIAFSLAALIAFYKGRWSGDTYEGERDGKPYPIRDDKPILDFFTDAWSRHGAAPKELASAVLANAALWDEDLTAIPDLADAVADGLAVITESGMRAAISRCM